MDLLMITLFLLLALLASNIIGHYVPFIPTALIQIAFGILLAILIPSLELELETEWFLLLFVAPLLYNDGRNFPKEDLWNMRMPILGNAIVLVLITTIGGGYFINWLIPTIPLAAAFALAAILSPTDPVAVNGIAKRIQIPEKILSVVRGESLINDASGLVAFKYAVAAAVSGYFSVREALVNFSYTFFIGAIVGLVLGFLLAELRFIVRRAGVRDAVFHSLYQVLMPFVIYLVAEHLFHASGVIAVVIGGVVQALYKNHSDNVLAEEQVLTENLWAIILFVLNGIVFLLLGLNIPSSMENSLKDSSSNNWVIIGYAILIGVVILLIRFVWSHLFSFWRYKRDLEEKPLLKMSLISSLVGVRGAVTMAGILSLPMVLSNGEPFPERSLILFLASGVILFTLIIATIVLPLLTESEEIEELSEGQLTFHEAKSEVVVKTVRRVRTLVTDENRYIAYEMIENLQSMLRQSQLEANADDSSKPKYAAKIIKLRLDGLRVEKEFIDNQYAKNNLDDAMYNSLKNSMKDREELLYTSTLKRIFYTLRRIFREASLTRHHYRNDKESFLSYVVMRQDVRRQAYVAAIAYLKEAQKTSPMPDIYAIVLFEYDKAYQRLNKQATIDSVREDEIREEINQIILETQREEIHTLYEDGKISREQEKELRRLVNYMENISLYEHVE